MPLTSAPWGPARKLALSAALFAGVLASCELALRAARFEHPRGVDRRIVWSEERDVALRAGDGLYRFDPVCLWSPRPGAEIPWTDGARVNPDGFRGPQLELNRRPGVLRIATMGGAAVLGVGVRWEDTFSARLALQLAERGVPAEVLCAGAEDHSVVQGLERWRHSVRHWRPHLVICTYSGSRDLTQAPQGRSDQRRIAELRGIPRQTGAHGLRDSLRLLHVASWLRDVASGVYWQERDLAFVERRLAPGVRALDWPGERRVHYDDFVAALGELFEEIRADGCVSLLLTVPRAPYAPGNPVAEVYQRGAIEVAERAGALVLDGRNAFVRSVAEEDIPATDLFLGETTPSDCGHAALAAGLVEEILARLGSRR
ncbi:MAG: hypothetical protein JNK02_00070 [Planctomycetes bacterium]|nr:hypothetical protein [Planctomycetota bacterium]